MKYLLSMLLILFFVASYAATPSPSRIDKVEEKVEQIVASETELHLKVASVQDRQELLQEKVDNLSEVIITSNDLLGNVINASNRVLTIASIIIGVFAAFLALYVSYLERKMLSMKDAVSKMSNEVEAKEKEVKLLVEQVNSDIGGLYLKIQREDTRAMLERLVKVPEDISNLIGSILSRDLEAEDFVLLKKAYTILKEKGKDNEKEWVFGPIKGEEYFLLFFQHFSGMAVEDNDLCEKIVPYFQKGLDCAFENDIIKIIEDLGGVLAKKQASFDRLYVLTHFIAAMNASDVTKDNPEYLEMLRLKVNDQQLWLEAVEKAKGIKSEEGMK